MIPLTHFNSDKRIALNVELIEKVEETPDTVITLTNGVRYLVRESLDEVIELSARARARIRELAGADRLPPDQGRLRLVRGENLPGTDGGEGGE